MALGERGLSRRDFTALGIGGGAAGMFTGLAEPAQAALGDPDEYTSTSHLQARPRAPDSTFVPDPRTPGLRSLGLDKRRDALLIVPEGLDYSKPIPLIVALHWFGGNASDGLSWFRAAAHQRKFLLLSPPSRGQTWDVDLGPMGPDAAFIDRAMDWVFQRFPVDPTHLAITGMSDGGSYALCMGLQNGDLFTDVLAFSPIRFLAGDMVGKPRFFFSAGRADDAAPLKGDREMVSQLIGLGYDAVLDIHNKGHIITDQGVKAALKRFLG